MSPTGLAVEKSMVYFTNSIEGGAILGVPKEGGSVVVVAAGQDVPICLARAPGLLAWGNSGDGTIRTLNLDDATAPVVLAEGQTNIGCVALAADQVVWTRSVTIEGAPASTEPYPSSGMVVSVPLGGGRSTTLAAEQDGAAGVAVHAGNVYWLNFGAGTSAGGSVMKVGLAGGELAKLAGGQSGASSIAVDATHAYWTNFGDGTVRRVDLAGREESILVEGLLGPGGIAVDASHVYFTDYDAGAVLRVPLAGGTTETMASGQDRPAAIALDDTHVFWANYGDGAVRRVAK